MVGEVGAVVVGAGAVVEPGAEAVALGVVAAGETDVGGASVGVSPPQAAAISRTKGTTRIPNSLRACCVILWLNSPFYE